MSMQQTRERAEAIRNAMLASGDRSIISLAHMLSNDQLIRLKTLVNQPLGYDIFAGNLEERN